MRFRAQPALNISQPVNCVTRGFFHVTPPIRNASVHLNHEEACHFQTDLVEEHWRSSGAPLPPMTRCEGLFLKNKEKLVVAGAKAAIRAGFACLRKREYPLPVFNQSQ